MNYIGPILIFIVILVVILLIYSHNPKILWEIKAQLMLKKLQPAIKNINEIHKRTLGNGKKISLLEKGKIKKSLAESKAKYTEYIEFCRSKELVPNLNTEQLDSVINEAEDILDPKLALEKELEKTCTQYDEIYATVNNVGNQLHDKRCKTIKIIVDVEQLVNSISMYPKSFDADIQEIKYHKENFKNTLQFAEDQKKILEKSTKSIGAGVAAGTAVASMAPTAAMWVATTFGTASTGTAISALSGAAATNAALAWLGGGALAAGGGGMAAGQALLALAGPIGWGIAGTSILASVLFAVRNHFKIQENKRNEIIKIKEYIEALKELKNKIEAISIQTTSLSSELTQLYFKCEPLKGVDYTTLDNNQKNMLGSLVNNTKALSALLEQVIA